MGMRVLVCGSRVWKDYGTMFNAIATVGKIDVLIEGGARGADRMAVQVAEALGIPFLQFTAEWELYDDAAGPIRNKRMLNEGKPTLVLAFHPNIEESSGTKDMVKLATQAKIEVIIIKDEYDLIKIKRD